MPIAAPILRLQALQNKGFNAFMFCALCGFDDTIRSPREVAAFRTQAQSALGCGGVVSVQNRIAVFS